MTKHNKGCECCNGISMDELRKKDAVAMERYGWVCHAVSAPEKNAAANFHTHGVMEHYAHRDFQIVLNIDPTICHRIVASCVNKVKGGDRFVPGNDYEHVINSYPVRIALAREWNREVARIIIPDEDGNLSREAMEKNSRNPARASFAAQWDGVLAS